MYVVRARDAGQRKGDTHIAKDSEATRASPDATTVRIVTGPTLRAPELEMIGAEEPALEPPPAPAAPKETQPAPDADLAEQIKRLGYRYGMLENAFFYPPPQPQQEAKQTEEIPPAAPLGVAGAGILFNTNSSSLFISKDVAIALVLLALAAVIAVGVIWAYNNTSLFKDGASASA